MEETFTLDDFVGENMNPKQINLDRERICIRDSYQQYIKIYIQFLLEDFDDYVISPLYDFNLILDVRAINTSKFIEDE